MAFADADLRNPGTFANANLSGTTNVEVSPSDAGATTNAESPTITQDHALASDDYGATTNSETPTLSQDHALSVPDYGVETEGGVERVYWESLKNCTTADTQTGDIPSTDNGDFNTTGGDADSYIRTVLNSGYARHVDDDLDYNIARLWNSGDIAGEVSSSDVNVMVLKFRLGSDIYNKLTYRFDMWDPSGHVVFDHIDVAAYYTGQMGVKTDSTNYYKTGIFQNSGTYKLRVVFDYINETLSVYVNGTLYSEFTDIPFTVDMDWTDVRDSQCRGYYLLSSGSDEYIEWKEWYFEKNEIVLTQQIGMPDSGVTTNAETPTVSEEGTVVSPLDSEATTNSETPTFSQDHALASDDYGATTNSELVPLAQDHALTPSDHGSSTNSELPVVTINIEVSSGDHGSTTNAETPTVQESTEVTPTDAEANTNSELPVLSIIYNLSVEDSGASTNSELPVLSQNHSLSSADYGVNTNAELPTFTQNNVFGVDDYGVTTDSELVTFINNEQITVDDAFVTTDSDHPTITSGYVVYERVDILSFILPEVEFESHIIPDIEYESVIYPDILTGSEMEIPPEEIEMKVQSQIWTYSKVDSTMTTWIEAESNLKEKAE